MLSTTKTALAAILNADPSITETARKMILAAASNPGEHGDQKPIPRIVTRSEAAKLFGVSVKRCDQLARAGTLKRVVAPGTGRAIGYTSESVRALAEGKAVSAAEGGAA